MATFNITRGGFRWSRSKDNPRVTSPPIVIVPVATAYGTAFYRGDAVKVLSDGTLAAAAAGDTIYGVFDSADQYYDGTVIRSGGSIPASVSWGTVIQRQTRARVIPVRSQIFRICADDATTATTLSAYQAFLQENAEWVAGTHVGDQSGTLLDISTHATTNTLSVRIEGICDPDFQDFASLGVNLEVSFNLIQDTASGSTTGT